MAPPIRDGNKVRAPIRVVGDRALHRDRRQRASGASLRFAPAESSGIQIVSNPNRLESMSSGTVAVIADFSIPNRSHAVESLRFGIETGRRSPARRRWATTGGDVTPLRQDANSGPHGIGRAGRVRPAGVSVAPIPVRPIVSDDP